MLQANAATIFKAALKGTTSAWALVASRAIDPDPQKDMAIRVWSGAMARAFA